MQSTDRAISSQGGWAVEGVLTVVFPTATCLLTALMAFGTRAISPASPAFQVVVNGFVVGVLVFAARRWRSAGLLTAAVVLTVGMLGFAPGASARVAVHTIILMIALTDIVFVSARLLPRHSRPCFLRTFLAWAVVSGVIFFLAGVVLLLLFRATEVWPYLRLYARLSTTLGLGLGLGFALRDRLAPSSGTR
ncbi:MAG TPA: hypothetical protein PLU87_17290 [Sedimentisphaerales bacterium]|nr:hypothetical protein [Sedimentisphaerales bacterium]HRS12740.1 hypothetical protein [Sedimentisphaerales bacterium]HRV49344.1 hypothetical protein [Sedimentisphaerales bacterium]